MAKRAIDKSIKDDFKYFETNPEITYLNSGTTALKLTSMVEKMNEIYLTRENTYDRSLSNTAKMNADDLEATFETVARHINAPQEDLTIMTGTTHSINTLARRIISELNDGDEIFVGEMEHHANLIPWFKYAKELNKDIKFTYYPLTDDFQIDFDKLKTMVNENTKLMAVAHVFNTVGVTHDIKKIREAIGDNVKLFVDGAQAISHARIDILNTNPDYYVFGLHKGFGPFGTAIAYIKNLNDIEEPFWYGGGSDINYDKYGNVDFRNGRKRFMAGSLDLPGIIAMKVAIDYIDSIGIDEIVEHNYQLKKYAEERITAELPNIRIINKGLHSPNVFFEVKGVSGEDVAYHLIQNNIIVRHGSACVKITNGSYNYSKVVRASIHVYNNKEDIDKLVEALKSGGDFISALFGKRKDNDDEGCKKPD